MTEQQKHILGNFEKALQKLEDDLGQMSALVSRSLDCAVRGLLERDDSLCNQSIADDDEIDNFEKQIDKDGMEVIVLFQPVAHDLRQVMSVMKVSANLERIGDQAGNIARRARHLNKNAAIPETKLIEPVYRQAAVLLNDSIHAFRTGDMELAESISKREDELDESYKEISKKLTMKMEESKDRIKDYLDLVFVARFLERVGDHAENISEDAIFVDSAVDVRHGGPNA